MASDPVLSWVLMFGIFVSGFQMARAIYRPSTGHRWPLAMVPLAMAMLFAAQLGALTGAAFNVLCAVAVLLLIVGAAMDFTNIVKKAAN